MTAEPPAAPPADDKDWTWVLARPCAECGLVAAAIPPAELPALIRRHAETMRERLRGPDVAVRPSAQVWSTLEYGAHVRDACRIFDHRLRRMLDEDDPQFENWDQDATAIESDYAGEDPATVEIELGRAATAIADRFAGVTATQWGRPGRRSNGSVFTVESLGRYFVHDLAHHAWDVTTRRP